MHPSDHNTWAIVQRVCDGRTDLDNKELMVSEAGVDDAVVCTVETVLRGQCFRMGLWLDRPLSRQNMKVRKERSKRAAVFGKI